MQGYHVIGWTEISWVKPVHLITVQSYASLQTIKCKNYCVNGKMETKFGRSNLPWTKILRNHTLARRDCVSESWLILVTYVIFMTTICTFQFSNRTSTDSDSNKQARKRRVL